METSAGQMCAEGQDRHTLAPGYHGQAPAFPEAAASTESSFPESAFSAEVERLFSYSELT